MGATDRYPRTPPQIANADLASVGAMLGGNGKGAQVWCNDFPSGAAALTWNGSAWAKTTSTGTGLTPPGLVGARVLTVASSGADYTTIAAALAAIAVLNDRSQSNPYQISIGHGTYVENVVLPQWVSLVGRGWRSIINGVLTVEQGCYVDNLRVEPTGPVEAAVRIAPTGSIVDAAWLNRVYAYNNSSQDSPTIAFLLEGVSANAVAYLNSCYGYARNTNAGSNARTVVLANTTGSLGYVEWRQGSGKTRPANNSSGKSIFAWQRNATLAAATNGSIVVEMATWNALYDSNSIWAQNDSSDPLAMHMASAAGVYGYGAAQHMPRLVGAVQYNSWSRFQKLDALPVAGEAGRVLTLPNGTAWHDNGTTWSALSTGTVSGFVTFASLPDTDAESVVTASWATATSAIQVIPANGPGNSAEDAAIEDVTFTVIEQTLGSFTVRAHSPNGSIGRYDFVAIGV